MSNMQAPKWLNDEARKHFEEIAGFTLNEDMFVKSDSFLVGLFANELTEYIECVKELEDGATTKMETGNGYEKEIEKPAVMRKERAVKNLLNMINKLGMSPEARNKMKIELAKNNTDDPFEQMMKKQLEKVSQDK